MYDKIICPILNYGLSIPEDEKYKAQTTRSTPSMQSRLTSFRYYPNTPTAPNVIQIGSHCRTDDVRTNRCDSLTKRQILFQSGSFKTESVCILTSAFLDPTFSTLRMMRTDETVKTTFRRFYFSVDSA